MDKRDFQEGLKRLLKTESLKRKLVRFAVAALCGFVFWTLALTPYMILVVKTRFEQYVAWIEMEAVLVPPLSILATEFINSASGYVLRKIKKRQMNKFLEDELPEWFK